MPYLVTAWKLNSPGTERYPPLYTIAAVARLVTAIVTQTDCDYITVRQTPDISRIQIRLDLPE